MMETRAMQQARYSPVVGQGIISGKAFVDHRRINEARQNAQDGGPALGAYPGGESDDNLSVMPGELSFGVREDRMMKHMMGGMSNEVGLTALAGSRYADYDSTEAFEDNFYFQGVVDTEYRVGSGNDPEHGYAFSRAGSKTTINNGPGPIYAGDLIMYRAPRTPKSSYTENGTNSKTMGNIVYQNRAGTPNTKYLWEIMRFDYTDFSQQFAGSFACMFGSQYDRDPGISDVDISEFWARNGNNDSKALTNLQSQAIGYKFGLLGAGLVMLENLARHGLITINDPSAFVAKPTVDESIAAADSTRQLAARSLGLWSKEGSQQQLQQEIISEMFLRNLPADLPERETAAAMFFRTHAAAAGVQYGNWKQVSTAYSDTDDVRYMRMRANLMQILCGGIAGSWYSKVSKIIGRAMNTSKVTGQQHVTLGHFTL